MEINLSARKKLEILYNLYEQPMYRVAFAILNSSHQAEDAVSEAFIKIVENLDKIKYLDSEKTKHYIIKIIKNTSINQYRRNQREAEIFSMSDDFSDIEDYRMIKEMEQAETSGVIDDILLGISEKYRNIILMRCVYEMSFGEIAKSLNEKSATVRKQYERAKKMVLKELRDTI